VSASLAAGLGLALASAAALNWGFVTQHGVASELPRLELSRPLRSLRLLFSSRRWLTGFVVGIAGWVFYVLALRLAPLSLVQAVSAGGIGVLAALVARRRGTALMCGELVPVVLSVAGLALLGISLLHSAGAGSHAAPGATGLWIVVSLAVAALAAAPLRSPLSRGAGLGLAAGVLYAAGDVATKAAVVGGAATAFVVAVLACHGLGFVALQLGFQRGGALATAGVATLWTNLLPIVAGTLLFREGIPAGPSGAARIAAFLLVLLGAAGLARSDADRGRRMTGSSQEGDDRRIPAASGIHEPSTDGRSTTEPPPRRTPPARAASAHR
jgi:hypothetical protein